MIDTQERVAMMSDEERVAFARSMKVEDYAAYPDYWQNHVEERIEQIHKKQIAGGTDAASFGIIADFHYTANCLYSPALMEKITKECGVPYFFLAGDFVSGMGMVTPENLIHEMVMVRRLFQRIEENMLPVMGNHDPAYSTIPGHGYGQSLDKSTLYEYVFRNQTKYSDRVFAKSGNYYYADDVFHKMRYVVLNTHCTPNDNVDTEGFPEYDKFKIVGFLQEQLDWFADVALKVPGEDWTVVLSTHESLKPAPANVENEKYYNWDVIYGIINAYRKHTKYEYIVSHEDDHQYDVKGCADFTGACGEFAAWVGGHTHNDITQYNEGILCLSSMSDSFNDIGNIDEQSFDIFTVNKKEHKIYATRIGRGEDREFGYEVF